MYLLNRTTALSPPETKPLAVMNHEAGNSDHPVYLSWRKSGHLPGKSLNSLRTSDLESKWKGQEVIAPGPTQTLEVLLFSLLSPAYTPVAIRPFAHGSQGLHCLGRHPYRAGQRGEVQTRWTPAKPQENHHAFSPRLLRLRASYTDMLLGPASHHHHQQMPEAQAQ